jgi:hypothetical protein
MYGELVRLLTPCSRVLLEMLTVPQPITVPKIEGLFLAEAVGFYRRENPQHAFLQRGSKAVCPMSQISGMLKNPAVYHVSRNLQVKFLGHFSPASVLH